MAKNRTRTQSPQPTQTPTTTAPETTTDVVEESTDMTEDTIEDSTDVQVESTTETTEIDAVETTDPVETTETDTVETTATVVPTTVTDVDPTPVAPTAPVVPVDPVVVSTPTTETTEAPKDTTEPTPATSETPLETFVLGRNPGIVASNPRLARTIQFLNDYAEKMGVNKPQTPKTLAVNQRQLYAALQYATEGSPIESAACLDAIVYIIQNNLNGCFSARMSYRQGDGSLFSLEDHNRLCKLVAYFISIAERNFARSSIVAGIDAKIHTNLNSALGKTNLLSWFHRF